VVRDVFGGGYGDAAAYPLDEASFTAVGEFGGCCAYRDWCFLGVGFSIYRGVVCRFLGVREREASFAPFFFGRDGPVGNNADALSIESFFECPVEIYHGLQMAVEQCTFRHFLHDLPKLALLHAFLGERKHHAWEDVYVIGD